MTASSGATWHAVDRHGRALATGRPPCPPGAPTPAAALATAPVIDWPCRVVDGDSRGLGVAAALGPGGVAVERLVSRLMAPTSRPPRSRLAQLAAATPAGRCDLPVDLVPLPEAAETARNVDPSWVALVAERRSEPRRALADGGRAEQLEAALNLTMLVAVEHLPATADGHDIRAASGAQLWLLGGMVAGALAGGSQNHFAPWAQLLECGLWPIGPILGALVVGDSRI